MEALSVRPDQPETTGYRQLEELEAYDNVATQFSELVDGSMRTDFELHFDGRELYGRDGRAMGKVTQTALEDSKELAKTDPDLWFEVRRRSLEREEYQEMLDMANGQGPNTIIVTSDFPPELMDAKEDTGGYNVSRKQTMLRVLTRQPDGNIMMHSRSLDGSNRQALEAIYEYFGEQPEQGELLGQRIRTDCSPEDQPILADRLMGVYDRDMTAQQGGEWYAGRRPADYRNTYEFVCDQTDIIEQCVDLELEGQLTNNVMYNMAATMQKRFKADQQGVTSLMPRQTTINPALLQQEIERAGYEARISGQSFSACGATLRADGLETSTSDQLGQAGYGNKTDEECEFISKECPECGTKNVKTKVTKTHIEGSCGCTKKK